MTSLRLGHRLENMAPNLHNGPGWRITLWTQGCVHRCTVDCLNPHYLDPAAGYAFAVEEIVARIQAEAQRGFEPLEGLTLLGGEPLEQPEACAELLRAVQALGLSTMVYTGFRYEGLQKKAHPAIEQCLQATDILVDGPFLASAYDAHLAWRGSRNQRLLCLSARYTPAALEAAFQQQGKGFSIQRRAGQITISGFQERRTP
jgi:anaerobic ribonucleoside-triphosphate reductase activating protein